MEFTDYELKLLSSGCIRMMKDACDATALIYDEMTKLDVMTYIHALQRLNTKICNYMEG